MEPREMDILQEAADEDGNVTVGHEDLLDGDGDLAVGLGELLDGNLAVSDINMTVAVGNMAGVECAPRRSQCYGDEVPVVWYLQRERRREGKRKK